MRILSTLFLVGLLLVPMTAEAGPPAFGTYRSNDIGGVMLTGRFSESFVGGGPGQVGNTIHAQSYDTINLGTQWRVECPAIGASPTEVSNTVDGTGTGEIVYNTAYTGGTFWLARNGPWGDNTVDYVGTVTSFVNVATYQFVGGTLVSIVSNVTLNGTFDDHPGIMEFVISNSATIGSTDTQAFPAGFPELRDDGCAPGPTEGAWGTVPSITLLIQQAVDADEASFGAVKARF
jgi:hypothetical protein